MKEMQDIVEAESFRIKFLDRPDDPASRIGLKIEIGNRRAGVMDVSLSLSPTQAMQFAASLRSLADQRIKKQGEK